MRGPMILLLLVATIATSTADATDSDGDLLARARQWQLEFRQGNSQVVGPLVRSLETAVARTPENADLWEALGNAYMSQQGVLTQSRSDPRVLIEVGKRARGAYARALALDKKNALLLASHGMAGTVTAMLEQDSAGLTSAVEEMNSAVRQAPKSTAVRLTRGFTIIHLPPGVRDTAAVVEDLNFVLETSPGGRPEDVLYVLLGDVYAEQGDRDAARREYEQVTGASRFAAEQALSRLDQLKRDKEISPAAIAMVRAGTGHRCVMCHAPGADN